MELPKNKSLLCGIELIKGKPYHLNQNETEETSLHDTRNPSVEKPTLASGTYVKMIRKSLNSFRTFLKYQAHAYSMAPVLYKVDASPPACAVRMLADIIGLELELKDVDIKTRQHKSAEYVKLNPLGTIPVLVEDTFTLSDSHAIMVYLLTKYGSDKLESLYPSEPRARAAVNEVMFFETGVLFVRIKVVALPTILGNMKSASPQHLSDMEEAYGMIEAFLSRHKYIAAEHLTIADLSVAATLIAAQAILKLDDNKFPLTAKWLSSMEEEPFFKKITTPGVAIFNKTMQLCWERNNKL